MSSANGKAELSGGTSIDAAVVATARLWIGTPYVHQASRRQAGADCLGLVRGIWEELYGALPVDLPPYTMDWAETRREESLWIAARTHLLELPLGELDPGNVILFRMRDGAMAKHLGIVSATGRNPKFIHSYSGHGTIENSLSAPWRRRIVARFAFPDGGQ